jgi:hypothetical protein
LLDDAISENFEKIEESNKELTSCAFLTSESVGISTLACLVMLSRDPRRIRMKSVGDIIKMRC